jgi:hypothetical protein
MEQIMDGAALDLVAATHEPIRVTCPYLPNMVQHILHNLVQTRQIGWQRIEQGSIALWVGGRTVLAIIMERISGHHRDPFFGIDAPSLPRQVD